MSFTDIHVDDFGWVAKLTLQQDAVTLDISSYTTKQIILVDPANAATTKTATFDTDGTDGVLKYTILDGDIDAVGRWHIFARVAKTGVELTSEAVRFTVYDRKD
jgi:hypothetical protein